MKSSILKILFLLCLIKVSYAQYNMIAAPQQPQYDCINCGYNYWRYYGPQTPMPFAYGQYPWWNQYGMTRYNNWNYPGMWHYPGNHFYNPGYPGNGDVVAMKPNVYVSGKKGTKFDLEIEFLEGSNLLIASPSLSSKWQGVFKDEGQLEVGGIDYRYLYYDYRFSGKHLQKTAGFCGQKAQIIDQMTGVLSKLNFQKNEIKDFLDHWPVKLPSSPYYCVFPQEKEELEKEVRLVVKADNYKLTQINFLVVPKERMTRNLASTIKPWVPKSLAEELPADLLSVREWGVSFVGKSY